MRLAVTTGDPAGIGPEVVDAACKAPIEGVEFVRIESGPPTPGKPSKETGRAALQAIQRATEMAIRKEVAGIVTAPVSKEHISLSGTPFTGHTEYIAALTGVSQPVMMFAGKSFRVSLVTTHVPIKDVSQTLTAEHIEHTLLETTRALQTYFGVTQPRLAVAGLNPHAGEGGVLGREEIEIIKPGMNRAREKGVLCEGPFAADTIFRRKEFDAIIGMYHDQALPTIKTLDPCAVNVTLGLPFVRTSPDHGTAFDIAGQGKADPAPMRCAIELAITMLSSDVPCKGPDR